jgi:beta-glucanase (GH16 family)
MLTTEQLAGLHAAIDEYFAKLTPPGNTPVIGLGAITAKAPVFDHVFDYTGEPDWSVWDSMFDWSDRENNGCSLPNNGERQWYVNHESDLAKSFKPWRVGNGYLALVASHIPMSMRPEIGYDQPDVSNKGFYRYFSGMIRARDFKMTRGYIELDVSLPLGHGLWPAFWLLGLNGKPPEFDIFEAPWGPNRLFTTAHTLNNEPQHIEAWGDFGQWHRIGALWEANKFTLFIDGMPAGGGVVPAQIDEPMYPIINLAVGGEWVEQQWPVDKEIFPAAMLIKRMTAWTL